MRVAILGGPGSGKGTQAKILAERYRVPQISTGDLLRDAVNNDQNLGEEAKTAMAEGRLVADEVVHKLLEERLRKKDTKRGFIIDGYPRSIPQAQALDTLLGMLGKTLQIAINIDVDDDALVKRIIGRSGCEDCGAIYNRFFSPPSVKNKCDKCGGKLVSRADDTAKTAQVRIGVYHRETSPLITYYRAQHKLRTMAGMGEVDEIHQKLCELVDLEIRPLEIKSLETAADTADEEISTIIAGGQINRVEVETVASKPRSKKKKAAPAKPVAAKTPAKRSKKAGSKKKKPTAKTGTVKKKAASKSKAKKTTAKKPIAKITASKKASASKSTSKKTTSGKTARKKTVSKAATKTTKKKTAVPKPAVKSAVKKKVAKKKVAKKLAKKVTKKTASKSSQKKSRK